MLEYCTQECAWCDLETIRLKAETTPCARFSKRSAKRPDPAISAFGTLDYYEKVVRASGGQAEADTFARVYFVPGMHHCSGPGPNSFDPLSQLEGWVERGVGPASVLATHSTAGQVDRTRPLCPHPQVARYTGRGSIHDAANFRCEATTH